MSELFNENKIWVVIVNEQNHGCIMNSDGKVIFEAGDDCNKTMRGLEKQVETHNILVGMTTEDKEHV